jgi:D-serine dehydratase
MMADSENIHLEPSALAGVPGAIKLFKDEAGQKYIENNNLNDKMKNAIHIAWATGGSMVPKDVMEAYYKKGHKLSELQI